MGEEVLTENSNKRKSTAPPEGYICRLCNVPGHWIQICPTKKTGSKRRKSDHVPVPGKDPSLIDIQEARELQKIPPPNCFCGIPSRLNKVKKSNESGQKSRAIGKYFFFCSKKRGDETQCRFARPVEMEVIKKTPSKEVETVGKAAPKVTKPGKDAAMTKQICKFFAKSGSCKKGKKCEFIHDGKQLMESKAVFDGQRQMSTSGKKSAHGKHSACDERSNSSRSGSNSSSSSKSGSDSGSTSSDRV